MLDHLAELGRWGEEAAPLLILAAGLATAFCELLEEDMAAAIATLNETFDRECRESAVHRSNPRHSARPVGPSGRSHRGNRARPAGGWHQVPIELRRRGVTRREYDVFLLLAGWLSNGEIGSRLFISPRTVEKHVAALLTKTGQRDRTALCRLAASSTTSQSPNGRNS